MSLQASPISDLRHDGFGSRYSTRDSQFGPVEILDVSAALAAPAAEQAIRACAARQAEANVPAISRVVRIARREQALTITSIAVDGLSLSDVLAALEFGTVTLGDEAILELAGATVNALATMHQMSGAPAHGALNPSHVMVRGDGSVVLTGSVFGSALEALQCNREQLWRIFGVAMPPSASLPRFDQRADVTQFGALAVAMLMRRTLTAAEYPKGILDLVEAATDTIIVSPRCRSALRMWLQQMLQLHPKALFASAADAARAYGDVMADVKRRRAGLHQLQSVMRQLMPGSVEEPPAMPAVATPQASPVPPSRPEPAAVAPPRGLPFLRHVLPALRAN